jgi:PAS domain S-box-containing protein
VDLGAMPLAAWVVDPAVRSIVAANDAAVTALRWSRDALTVASAEQLFPSPARAFAEIERAARERITASWQQLTSDASPIDVEAGVSKHTFDGRDAWLVVATRIGARTSVPPSPRALLERLEAVFAHAEEGFSLTGRDGALEYVSPAIERMLGYRPDELVGTTGTTVTHPDDLAKVAPKLEALWREPGARDLVLTRSRTKEGDWRWLETSLTNLLDEPSVRAIAGHFRDVTEREDARRAHDETRRRFQYLLSATSAVTYTLTAAPPIRSTFMSENVEAVLGYAPSQFLDTNFWKAGIHPDDRERLLGSLPRMFEEGRHVYEYRFRHANGSWVWLRDDLVLVRDEQGAPRELIGCFVDVTSQREAESAMKRSEANFRTLIESSPVAVIVQRDGCPIYANPAMIALLGYDSVDEVLRLPPYAYAAPDRIEVARERTKFLMSSGVTRVPPIEGGMVRKDGTIVAAEIEALKLDFDGEPAVVVLARDLTERRAMLARAAVADRLASVGTLAAGVAHEINNPLTYVLANLSLLSDAVPKALRTKSAGSEQQIESLLRDARDGATRIQSLVRDLRVLAHPDRESMTKVDLRDVIESCLRMAQNEIKHRARLITRFDDVPPVLGNRSRLSQVVLNLVINAAQAIPDGDAATHEVGVTLSAVDDGRIAIEVTDTGVGIPEDLVSHIFDPFFTTKPIGEGTGLGLAICHGIVSSMKGEITVRNRMPHGTTFRVLLPPYEGILLAPHAQVAAPREGAERMRILVIDDEPNICRSLELMWKGVHDVHSSTRAATALARLQAGETFDVILCDLMMPEMTGMKFYDALCESRPELAPRVVFLTGGAFTPASREFMKRVPNRCLGKPFDMDALAKTLRDAAPART